MKKVKLCLARFSEKHPILLFAVSCILLLGWIVTENLVNLWSILHKPEVIETDFFAMMALVMLISGALLFPFGLVFAKKNRLFSEYWLALIAEVTLFGVLVSLGFQPPYCDDPYYDRPLLLILYNTGFLFALAAVIQGPLLAVAYYFFTDKEKRKRTIGWRIFLSIIALLLSAFLIFCIFWLFHT